MTDNIFRKFNDLVLQVMLQFYVWKHLQHSENNSAYNARGYFWVTVITTLHQAFLLNLASFFDPDKRVLSAVTFLDHLKDPSQKQTLLSLIHSPEYKDSINRLIKWRNNMLAHKNMDFVLNPEKLPSKFPITYEEMENLMKLLIKILDETKRVFNPRDATNYSDYYKMIEDGCREHVNFVLNNGLKKK